MNEQEFIDKYIALQTREDVQQMLINVAKKQLDEIDAAQAELATQHLCELTELRAGQAIELAQLNGFGNFDWSLPVTAVVIKEVMQADVSDPDEDILDGASDSTECREILITVWASAIPGAGDPVVIRPHPGNQWRYPSAATCVTAHNPKEAA